MWFNKNSKIAIGVGTAGSRRQLFFTTDENMRHFDDGSGLWSWRETEALPCNIDEISIEAVKDFLCKVHGFKRENIFDRTKRSLRIYEDVAWYNKDSRVMIGVYYRYVMLDIRNAFLVFTLPENIDRKKQIYKDTTKIQRIPDFKTFKEAKQFLIQEYGFKEENIEEIEGDEDATYKLGTIFF